MILGTDTAELARLIRRGAAISQETLAGRAGLTQATIAGIETGRRVPSLTALVRIAEAAGRQLRVEIEPLDVDITERLADAGAVERARRDVGAAVTRVFDASVGAEVDPPPYRVEGVAALALLGAPVPKPRLELALADTAHSLEWLTQRRNVLAMVRIYRDDPAVDPWQWALSIPPFERETSAPGRLGSYESTRGVLTEATRGRPFWVETAVGRARVRLADPAEVARSITVSTPAGPVSVAPLESLVVDDRQVARYLRVMRSRVTASTDSPR